MTDHAMARKAHEDGPLRVRTTLLLPGAFEDTLIPLIERLRRI